MQFLYKTFPPRANFIETITPEEDKILEEHFLYLQDLTRRGVVYIAGPVTDGRFGIVVFDAESEINAREIMLSDPAAKAGLFGVELYPFRVSLFRGRD